MNNFIEYIQITNFKSIADLRLENCKRINLFIGYPNVGKSNADTLQRVIFYKTAIASNKNSVLLFEEPEANAFPPYIKLLTQDIIDAENNQFFIVTHSPIIVEAFLELAEVRKELSIYVFDFKNNQTVAKRLSDKDMSEIYEYGMDLFFNLESYL